MAQRSAPDEEPWHSLAIDEVFRRLESGREGLSVAEAARRLAAYGPNTLPRDPPPAVWRLAVGQLANPLMLLLMAAAAGSIATGDVKDAAIIAVVIAIDACLGTWQEFKANRSSRALERLLHIRAAVSRGGTVCDIPAEEVVPGDLLWIESGNRVPADARLISAHGLEIDESLLTGESLPVCKNSEWTGDSKSPLADRLDMIYAGSIVTRGRAAAIVVATGTRTSVGALAIDVATRPAGKPPLVARMERFTRSIAVAVVVAATLIGLLGVMVGQQPREMFLFAVVLAVSAIPEGLPVSLTIALAIATGRMAARGAIVRRLPAVEGLGSCTLIATDKTGTLTCNELTATVIELPAVTTDAGTPDRLVVSGQGFAPTGAVLRHGLPVPPKHVQSAATTEPRLRALVTCGVLCNEATLHHRDGAWTWRGDAVDVALLSLGVKLGLEREALLATTPQSDALPFEPEHRFAATFHDTPHGRMAYVKGAPEAVLPMCDGDLALMAGWHERATALAAEGLRVLALAQGRAPTTGSVHAPLPVLANLEFLGFIGLTDPLRPATREAVRQCGQAGIRVVMITGDHRLTSLAIAQQLDLAHDESEVITGGELADASPARFAELVDTARVFARVTPRQKLQIVEAARAAGHFVAVTGDGANDAPALRAANLGVAMGRSGTDVAREAAGLVISDDNFATIVAGIEEGRIAYDNVRKVIFLLVSTGAAEMVLVTLAVATGSPLPLTAVQLLWLNLVTNGIQDVALAFEPGQGDELERQPRPPGEAVFDRVMLQRIMLSAVVMGVASFTVFRFWLGNGLASQADPSTANAATLAAARNATLLVMVLFENAHLANCRSETRSAFLLPLRRSPFLLMGTLVALGVHLLAMHWPPVQSLLDITPVSGREWLILMAVAASILPAVELHKWWRRRRTTTFTARAA
jgi:magnesium-transporting ATPase (P-type)